MTTSLKNLFREYTKIVKRGDDLPHGFWTTVSEYWSQLEGEEHLSNNAVRKRFKRRLNKNYYEVGEELSDIDQKISEQDPNEYDQEFKTKQDFDKIAEDMDAKDAYQAFLKEHNINEEDVVNVYFKEKASGIYFTVQTRFNREDENFDPLSEIKDVFGNYKPLPIKKVTENHNERVGIVGLFDCHIDKISWLLDTDEENNLEDNIERFRKSFDELLQFMQVKKPEKIIFPIGNDFFQTNNQDLSTKKGTDLKDTISTNPKLTFRVGVAMIRECIDKLYSITNDLIIVSVRGNHDYDRVFYFTEVLKMAYENHDGISFIDNERSRNYVRYGDWLFGFAHGDNERQPNKLPMLMAIDKESKVHWSEISRAVYFLGDIHHEKRFLSPQSEDFQGCEIKYLRAMTGVDSWHWQKGYVGVPKTAYAFVYDKNAVREYEHKVSFK